MKTGDLIAIGALCLGGYFLYKMATGEGLDFPEFGGAGGGGGGFLGGGDDTPSYTPPTAPLYSPAGTQVGVVPGTTPVTAPTTRQSWTNVTYGQPGQPSQTFLVNTLKEGGAAAAAAKAGAPPRVVAKIKAGKIF